MGNSPPKSGHRLGGDGPGSHGGGGGGMPASGGNRLGGAGAAGADDPELASAMGAAAEARMQKGLAKAKITQVGAKKQKNYDLVAQVKANKAANSNGVPVLNSGGGTTPTAIQEDKTSPAAGRVPSVERQPSEDVAASDANEGPYSAQVVLPDAATVEHTVNEEALFKALTTLHCNGYSLVASSVKTIKIIFANIRSAPLEEKFRKIKFASKLIQTKISAVPGALETLLSVGFEVQTLPTQTGGVEAYLVFPKDKLTGNVIRGLAYLDTNHPSIAVPVGPIAIGSSSASAAEAQADALANALSS